MHRLASCLLTWVLGSGLMGAAHAADRVAEALRAGGATLLIRHAATPPGKGDPPGFRLDDCATQRNLSDEGRAQAVQLGERLRAAGLGIAELRSSQYCRCLDTAKLTFGAERGATPAPELNFLIGKSEANDAQTAAVRAAIAAHRGPGTLVLITHTSNIAALTGLLIEPGDVLAVRAAPGGEIERIGLFR